MLSRMQLRTRDVEKKVFSEIMSTTFVIKSSLDHEVIVSSEAPKVGGGVRT